jgi:glucuronate isomerase
MGFLDDNYLLESDTARQLYERIKDLPILDAHNHGDVKEIVENKGWDNIWAVEGKADHYVWQLMRKRGVPEEKITGSVSDKEKWLALAEVFPHFAGNPTYEWIHLDLKRRFGIDDIITKDTALSIWEKTCALLKEDDFKPQKLLKDMKVEIMCTTDDPTSDLAYHKQVREEIDSICILPTWRPDKVMNIDKKIWRNFVVELGEKTKTDISTVQGLIQALEKSHDYFAEQGCVASDHGLLEPFGHDVAFNRASGIYEKAIAGICLEPEEVKDFKAFMLHQFGRMNKEKGWVMQLHIGPVRDYRDSLKAQIGPDAGGDLSTNHIEIALNLKSFLNKYAEDVQIVLYCLDPGHLPTLITIARAFPNISLGAAWWFNDSPYGMEHHLKYTASVDLLSNSAGMVTDSRKLFSYGSRTEMFRRVLCNVVGGFVNKGQIPYETGAFLVENVSYYRPKELFFSRVMP